MRTGRRKTFADSIRLPAPGGVVTRVAPVSGEPGMMAVRVGRSAAGRLSFDAAERMGLREGIAWTAELRDRVMHELVGEKAREFGLRIAAGRPLTRRQVSEKLMQRGLAIGPARAIAENLASRGVIDEAALALHLATGEFSRRKSGKSLIMVKLRRRGVDAKTAQQATDAAAADSGIDPASAALELARKKVRTLPRGIDPRAAGRRVYAFLARRGFDPGALRRAAREALAERNADT